jgi:hypothetical protein
VRPGRDERISTWCRRHPVGTAPRLRPPRCPPGCGLTRIGHFLTLPAAPNSHELGMVRELCDRLHREPSRTCPNRTEHLHCRRSRLEADSGRSRSSGWLNPHPATKAIGPASLLASSNGAHASTPRCRGRPPAWRPRFAPSCGCSWNSSPMRTNPASPGMIVRRTYPMS